MENYTLNNSNGGKFSEEDQRRKHHLHIDLETQYKPIQKHGMNNVAILVHDKANMRMTDLHHVDL